MADERTPARVGRPTKLTQPYTRPDGTTTTIGDRFLERLAAGLPQKLAAADAGISEQTITNWRLKAAHACQAVAKGQPVTEDEEAHIEFLGRLERAPAEWAGMLIQQVADAASKPQTIKKVVVKRAVVDGALVEVERTETVEERPAQWAAAMTMLERRLPEWFARRVAVDTTSDGVSGEERADQMVSELGVFLAGAAEADEAAGRVIDVAEASGD